MIRSLAFNTAFYITTALFLLLGSPLLLAPRPWAMAGLRAHARTTVWLLRWIVGARMVVRGRENLPEGAYLVAAKHQSAWDTIALILLFPDPALVMKAELLRIPVYGWFCKKFGMIPIQRETGPSALRAMLKEAKARAADGRQVLVFPEGTRRAPGAPPDYKPGVLLLYDALEIPCVPVALNSGLFWPRASWMRHGGDIVVDIQPALPAKIDRKAFRTQLIDAIEQPTAQLVAEAEAAKAD